MFLHKKNLVIFFYQTIYHGQKTKVFLQFVFGELQLNSLAFIILTIIQYRMLQKGRIFEKKQQYNLCIFCSERQNAEGYGNLLEMLIAAITFAFQTIIFGQLEFTRIAWNLWKNLYGCSWPSEMWMPQSRDMENVESRLKRHLQTCSNISAFVITQWKGFSS